MNRTFSIIKPDATKRNITGSINKIIEDNNLVIIAQKRTKLTKEKAEGFYSIHKDKPFFNDLIEYMTRKELTVAEAPPESVENWHKFVHEKAEGLLSNEIDSWMTGVNLNVEGKQTRTIVRYSGTAPEYRERCDQVAASGYNELHLL